MEEVEQNKDHHLHQNSRDSSSSSSSSAEEDSNTTMSLSPNLPSSPPMILPHRGGGAAQQQSHNNNNNNRTTNFFIDNILRPDFGCRKEGCRAERLQGHAGLTTGRENVNPLILQSRPSHGSSLCLDSNCSSDSTNSSSSSSSSSSSPSSKQQSSGKQGDTVSSGTNNGTSRYASDSPSAIMVMSGGGGNGGSSSPPPANTKESQPNMLWPAWVYCTRYSDRPSSGPRTRKLKKKKSDKGSGGGGEDKRPRTAFTAEQLQRLKTEFTANRYITEQRRQSLATELGLNESQIKIWFQNKRAKIKKATGYKNGLALQLMAQGLYNHSTTTVQDGGGGELGGGGGCGGGPGEDSD